MRKDSGQEQANGVDLQMKKRRRPRNMNIYTVYKGEEYIMDGTLDEIAERRKVKRKTLQFMLSAAYRKRAKSGRNWTLLVLLEEA